MKTTLILTALLIFRIGFPVLFLLTVGEALKRFGRDPGNLRGA